MKKLFLLMFVSGSVLAQNNTETRTYYLPGRIIHNPTPVEYWRRAPVPQPQGYIVQVTPAQLQPQALQPSPNDPPLDLQKKLTDLSRQ